jgi:ADP-ribosylation factor-binding protein GGA
MEAASARMAARDRYGGWGEAPTSQLQRFICTTLHWTPCSVYASLTSVAVNACDPQNFEPNLALNLEISDLINTKKGSTYETAPLSWWEHADRNLQAP